MKHILYFFSVFSLLIFGKTMGVKHSSYSELKSQHIEKIYSFLDNSTLNLFHLQTEKYWQEFLKIDLLTYIDKKQNYAHQNLIGKPFHYVLYKLGFLNTLIKPLCDKDDICSGYMFWDMNNKRLLILYTYVYPCNLKEQSFQNNLSQIENLKCCGLEIFLLKEGIYEFAGFLPEFSLKKNSIIFQKEIPAYSLPGIERDYYFKKKVLIKKDLFKFLKNSKSNKSVFKKKLEDVDKKSKKEYQLLKKRIFQNPLYSHKVRELKTIDESEN